jgi:hypothetical protein
MKGFCDVDSIGAELNGLCAFEGHPPGIEDWGGAEGDREVDLEFMPNGSSHRQQKSSIPSSSLGDNISWHFSQR